MIKLLETHRPHEVYNLAAQSFVPTSLRPAGAHRRDHRPRRDPAARRHPGRRSGHPLLPGVLREMFGKVAEVPQTRDHAVLPPLALRGGQGLRPLDHGELPRELRPARLLGHPVQPRVTPPGPGVPAPQGVLQRGQDRPRHAATSSASATSTPSADWGFAGDYVEAMWLMLQQDEPDDYVISTGETHEVREFCPAGVRPRRPRLGGPRRDRRALLPSGRGRPADRRLPPGPRRSWGGSRRTSFAELVQMMVDADLALAKADLRGIAH